MGLDSGRMRGSTSFCLSVCLTLCFFQLKVGGAAFCLLNQNELLQCRQHHYHETIIINPIKIVHMSHHHHHPHPTRDFHWNHSFILAGGGDGGNGAAAHDIIHMPPKWLE